MTPSKVSARSLQSDPVAGVLVLNCRPDATARGLPPQLTHPAFGAALRVWSEPWQRQERELEMASRVCHAAAKYYDNEVGGFVWLSPRPLATHANGSSPQQQQGVPPVRVW